MTMSSRPCDLGGLVALVTGAGGGSNGGLGAVIARELARAGAQIAVHDVVAEAAEVTASELRQLGFVAEAFSADITDSREADRLVGQVIERFGKIDILVNNAEYRSAAYRPDQIPTEEWQRSVALNVHAPFYLSRAAVRDMRTRKFGRIVNVSNIAAIRASILHGVPYVTKPGPRPMVSGASPRNDSGRTRFRIRASTSTSGRTTPTSSSTTQPTKTGIAARVASSASAASTVSTRWARTPSKTAVPSKTASAKAIPRRVTVGIGSLPRTTFFPSLHSSQATADATSFTPRTSIRIIAPRVSLVAIPP